MGSVGGRLRRNACLTFILSVCFLIAVDGNAQSWLDRPVTVTGTDATRASYLFQVSEQADVGLAYVSEWAAMNDRLTLYLKDRPVREVLDQLLTGSGLVYKATEMVLVIRRERITVSGYLEAAESGERLVGGTIYAPASGRGTLTNGYGFFSLEVPVRDSLLRFSYLGYAAAELRPPWPTTVRLRADGELPQATVIAYREAGIGDPPVPAKPALQIVGTQLRNHAGPGGEADLFGLIHQQTGSQRGADGLGGLAVRGGGADQNLVLLDDVPVFQPAHAFGLFSVINPLIVRSATFYADGFPARYGGRLGAVLDVRSREGNTERATAEVALSTFATKAVVETPTLNGKGALLLAGRRTHLDPFIVATSRNRKEENGDAGQVNYDFFDLHLKWHHQLADKDRLFLSGYLGGDSYGNFNLSPSPFVSNPVGDSEEFDQQLDWGSRSGTLRWNHLFSGRLFTNATLTYGKYRYQSDNLLDTRTITDGDTSRSFFLGLFESDIRDLGLKVDADYYRGQHHLRLGAFTLARRFLPGAILDQFKEADLLEDAFVFPQANASESGVYLEDELTLNDRWTATAGLRLTAYGHDDRSYWLPQPRLRIGYNTNGFSAYASAGRMVQPLHLLTESGANLPTDIWVPATEAFRPQSSWQLSVAGNWNIGPGQRLSANLYYRTMSNLVRYPEEINWPGLTEATAEFWEDEVVAGEGYSYGLGLRYDLKRERHALGLSYGYSRSFRVFAHLNAGERFPFAFDRPHKVVLNASRRIGRRLWAYVDWEFSSGRPITLLETETEFDPLNNFPDFSARQVSDLNGFRLAAYHRLDLAVAWRWQRQQLRLGVYNAYDRFNTYYAYDLNDGIRTDPLRVRSLPLLPTISYTVKFSGDQGAVAGAGGKE